MATKSLFISQPMSGLTTEEILSVRNAAIKLIQEKHPEHNIVAIDSFRPAPDQGQSEYNKITAVVMLGESLSKMAGADIIYFAPGWQKSKGCQIENEVARRWLEETGVELIEDGTETIDLDLEVDDIEKLKSAADDAGLSLNKYLELKLKEALTNGTMDKIVEELTNENNN